MESGRVTQRRNGENALGPEIGGGKKTILMYSRDLNFSLSLSAVFQDRFNVITTTNAAMLESFVAHYSADLVIVDADPSESMIERIGSLKGLNKDLPIIALYVYNQKEVSLDGFIRSHVDSVFYKPLEIHTISKRIEELLPA
jgi:DNA-binding response OmpR family regulator